jgi:hypothetical protein
MYLLLAAGERENEPREGHNCKGDTREKFPMTIAIRKVTQNDQPTSGIIITDEESAVDSPRVKMSSRPLSGDDLQIPFDLFVPTSRILRL